MLRLLGEGYEPADIERITGQSKRTVRRLVDEGRARGRAARRNR
ncbi:hypothetical protein [Conexibacter sp. W3-3-2]|nr:hypothetical protein [Conexibacter sp. W3-3-2]